MKHLLVYSDTEDYEVEISEHSNLDDAYTTMEESYQEQVDYHDSSIVDNGIDDEKAYIELDDGRRMFWNIK